VQSAESANHGSMRRTAREVIFVIGMHRSGTSAFARALSLCGAALPLSLMPANHANPTGYWEPQHAVDLNDLFLRSRSSSWSDASLALAPGAESRTVDDAFVSLIGNFFETGFEPTGPMVLKDPRITALLPYWSSAAGRQGLRMKVVHVFRHPLDVASSLAERDGLALDHALALWLKYNLLGELDTRGKRRIFVSYEELMEDWQAVLGRCADELALDITIDDEAKAAVAGFLSPQLHHHNVAVRNVPVAAPPLVKRMLRIHGILQRAALGHVEAAKLDAMRADVQRFAGANGAVPALTCRLMSHT
jgi:hypothetical protein